MNKIDQETVQQLFKYFLFSGLAVLVNIISRMVLSNYLNMGYYIAITIAYIFGMFVNFILNKNYNFPEGPRKYYQELRTFIVISFIGLLLTNVLAYLLLMLIQSQSEIIYKKTIAHILAVGFVSIYSFTAHKLLTYKGGIRETVKFFYKKHIN